MITVKTPKITTQNALCCEIDTVTALSDMTLTSAVTTVSTADFKLHRTPRVMQTAVDNTCRSMSHYNNNNESVSSVVSSIISRLDHFIGKSKANDIVKVGYDSCTSESPPLSENTSKIFCCEQKSVNTLCIQKTPKRGKGMPLSNKATSDGTFDSGYGGDSHVSLMTNASHISENTENRARSQMNVNSGLSLTTPRSPLRSMVPSSPFTCAQRTCKELTFLYSSPNTYDPVIENSLTPFKSYEGKVTPSELVHESESDWLDSTLDILRSLESDDHIDHQHSGDLSLTNESQSDVDTTISTARVPVIRLKRRNHMDPNSQKRCLNAEAILTQSITPNRRNSKRISENTNQLTDIHPPSHKCTRRDEMNHPPLLKMADFIKSVTSGTIQGNTRPRTPVTDDWKYQTVPKPRPKKATNSSTRSPPQDEEGDDTAHNFLKDKTDADKDNWYIGRRLLGGATKTASRRSFLRQAFNHNLMTEWATSHETMPPWLRSDELDTRVFEIKAKAARDIMKESIDYLNTVVEDLEQKSAASLAKIEPKFTPEELLTSRAALAEHGRVVSDPLKQVLSDKREYLRRNQPTLTDLITMRNRDCDFPRKSNPPPQKKRAPSAALGRAPDNRGPGQTPRDNRGASWADDDKSDVRERRNKSPRRDNHQPRRDPTRGGGNYHYDNDNEEEKENSKKSHKRKRSPRRSNTPNRQGSTSRDDGDRRAPARHREDFPQSRRGRGAPRQNRRDQRKDSPEKSEKARGQKPSRSPRRR